MLFSISFQAQDTRTRVAVFTSLRLYPLDEPRCHDDNSFAPPFMLFECIRRRCVLNRTSTTTGADITTADGSIEVEAAEKGSIGTSSFNDDRQRGNQPISNVSRL